VSDKTNSLSCVYHVGFLDVANCAGNRTKTQSVSFEGSGLSISLCPAEWTKIAKLGGGLVYILKKDSPKFLMAHNAEMDKILAWCVDMGFLVRKKKFRSYQTDEEGEEYFAELDTRRQAEEETYDEIKEVDGYSFGPKGRAYWKSAFLGKPSNGLAESFAVIFYAEAHDYDGVYWTDDLDVSRLSAPRGVIFQHKLPEWTVELTSTE
jgi:hypothetical protein